MSDSASFEGLMQEFSVITCPVCQHAKNERMPSDACQRAYKCERCGHQMQSVKRDTCGCVFCLYGSVPCPPCQSNQGCCKAA
jgi:hypothetical protein